jgi:hypothetical protein
MMFTISRVELRFDDKPRFFRPILIDGQYQSGHIISAGWSVDPKSTQFPLCDHVLEIHPERY